MKILNKNKNKFMKSRSIKINLTIKELDSLINFLIKTKDGFILKKEDASLSKLMEIDGETRVIKITNFKDIIMMRNEIIDCHTHFQDYYEDICNGEFDIELHTTFKAKEKEDGTFEWVNINSLGNAEKLKDKNLNSSNGNKKHQKWKRNKDFNA